MKKFVIQRGKTLLAPFDWVHFAVQNLDIMSTISDGPLKLARTGEGKLNGTIFVFALRLEHLDVKLTDGKCWHRLMADVRMPMGLGRTYTIAKNTYCRIDSQTTSLDMDLEAEVSGIMRLCLNVLWNRIDGYLNRICGNFERTACVLERGDALLTSKLDTAQLQRIESYREQLRSRPEPQQPQSADAEARPVRKRVPGAQHDVTLSYSIKNKPVANAVVALLEKRGICCWIAPRDIAPGGKWAESIMNAIANCRVMVLIFSSDSNTSKQVLREVDLAVKHEKVVIPFRIENVAPSKAMEYYISVAHWMDALDGRLEEHVHRLGEVIERLVSEETAQEETGSTS